MPWNNEIIGVFRIAKGPSRRSLLIKGYFVGDSFLPRRKIVPAPLSSSQRPLLKLCAPQS